MRRGDGREIIKGRGERVEGFELLLETLLQVRIGELQVVALVLVVCNVAVELVPLCLERVALWPK